MQLREQIAAMLPREYRELGRDAVAPPPVTVGAGPDRNALGGLPHRGVDIGASGKP